MPSASVASSSSKAMSPLLFTSDFDGELFEILFETNLLQFYHNFSSDLKIYSTQDLRGLTDSELESVGLNPVEVRRLRRAIKRDSGHNKPFLRLRKKFSFRAPSRTSFDSSKTSDRFSIFSVSSSHSGTQDDSSSIFRSATSSVAGSFRNSVRHLSLSRCNPAPPLVALLDPDFVTMIPTKILGEGEFATVYQGLLRKDALNQDKDGMVGCMGFSGSIPQSHFKALSDSTELNNFGNKSSKLLTVAIKKFAPNCLGRPLHVFLQHVALLSDLRHPNLLHIFGCYTDEYCQPALVCEFASLRSLIDVFGDPDLRAAISPMHLCHYAEQVASAMAYLERRRIVHGDLACRNIMLSNTNINSQVKVADYGLLKALGILLMSSSGSSSNVTNQTPPSSSANSDDASTSTDHSKLRLPVAWCAPETLRVIEMTSSSDVWSYGVTLWEMFSYGEQPWSQLTATEILDTVDAPCGQRLAQPDFCPRDYYDDVMIRCWRHDASDRPTFAFLEQHMPLVRPDQVQTVKSSAGAEEEDSFGPFLAYSKGEIITVLDKRVKSTGVDTVWKGVTSDGFLGLFHASDVVFYTELLVPSSGAEQGTTLCIAPTPPLNASYNQSHQLQDYCHQQPQQGHLVISPPPISVDISDNLTYEKAPSTDSENPTTNTNKMPNESGKSKQRFGGIIPSVASKGIDTSMISLPRGDLRHIGHIGYDGAVSGRVDFIAPGVEKVCLIPPALNAAAGSPNRFDSTNELKRADSFEEGFTLPNLSLESEMQEIMSTIRLSDFLLRRNSGGRKHNIATEDRVHGYNNGFVNDSTTPGLMAMRQPRQPSAFLQTIDRASSETPPRSKTLLSESNKDGNTAFTPPRATAISPACATSSSGRSTTSETNLSPLPTTTSSPIELAISHDSETKADPTAGSGGSQSSLSSWRYVDSPSGERTDTDEKDKKMATKVSAKDSGAEVETVSPVNATANNLKSKHGQRRASIVTGEERQHVYEEVRRKCGHPLLMSDCLRAVSYTQGNIDAAVKFLKLQYLASHRVAEVERCKNALVACDWEVDNALEMLRLRSTKDSANGSSTNILQSNGSHSDTVNV